ncbi:hypothetical protein JCM11641_003439 [Rhodosporidiobolus odoratus]
MTSKLLQTASRSSLYRSVALPRLSRSLATTSSSSFSFTRPSPPPLPPKEQREFEELIRRSSAPLSRSTSAPTSSEEGGRLEISEGLADEVHHPDYRARPKADFQGEVNPRTGESGGPKREPLVHGDWAYGGKVTDF